MTGKITDGAKIVFIGDSITDCGRREAQRGPLGDGYVKLFADMMTVRHPELKLTVVNRGIGGDSIDQLRSRWYEDVLSQKPDTLSVKIGINDLHKHLLNPDYKFLTLDEFRSIYTELLQVTRQTLPECNLLLISPFYISRDNIKDSQRKKILDTLPPYIAAVEEVSRQFNTDFINLHELFQRQLDYQHPDTYCIEPVHPNSAGHLLIAEAVYQVLVAGQ